ncbi:MAG: SDR family NAD(P)-dependent oxidoreductase [Bacteroidota bacterium]
MLQLTQRYPKKRAFITGGGSGLGKAFSLQLAEDGWTIGICDINKKGMEQTANAVKALGGKAFTYRLDVSDEKAYQKVAEAFLDDADGIDLLINNAGVGDGGSFHTYPLENWHWLMGINFNGVLYGCYFFVPYMRQQKNGHIINIASMAGIANAPSTAPYNVSKAAVISLSETLFYELHPHNVKVSSVEPTFFKTNVLQHARGPKATQAMAQRMIDRSDLEVEPVAQEILAKAGQEQLHIILPKSARQQAWMKRFFPKVFQGRILKMVYKMREKLRTEGTAELGKNQF